MKNPFIKILILSSLGFFATACDKESEPNGDGRSRMIELSVEEYEASRLCNWFAWDLLDKCNTDPTKNVVISPFSANMCLSMMANAAADDSRLQLLKALGYDNGTLEYVNALNKKVAQNICNLDNNVKLSIANSLWYDPILNPKKDFLNEMDKNYNISSHKINHSTFAKDVNSWVNKKTNGLLPKIVDDNNVKNFAFMNAIYFKGKWHQGYKFEKSATKQEFFYSSDGSEAPAYFMCNKIHYQYYCAEKWRAMSIPFGDGAFRFTVILPDDGCSIEECMTSIKEVEPATCIFDNKKLELKLPKFEIKQETDLVEVLKAMGVEDIFNEIADFSYMTILPIVVDLVKQGVNFKIDEAGAEAAAVTIGAGWASSPGPVVDDYELFYVDRPFIYMISEKSSGAILFLGCINKFTSTELN